LPFGHAAWARRLRAVIPLLACGCTGSQLVKLGDISPPPYHFGAPAMITELGSTGQTGNPTLTDDLLEIYFTTDRVNANSDIWFATRGDAAQPFSAPAPVVGVNSVSFETSSAISADGLTLWFGSDRAGGVGAVDVWVSTRPTRSGAWSTPLNVVALNSPVDDIPRPPGQRGLVMPLASQRNAQNIYQTYLADRTGPGAPFGAPQIISELAFSDRSTVDACLTDDGLTLFFSSTPASASASVDGSVPVDGAVPTGDLYVAWRRSVDEPFSVTQPLGDLNTPRDERDPWLSPDGKLLFFTSDRDGALNIYVATVDPR